MSPDDDVPHFPRDPSLDPPRPSESSRAPRRATPRFQSSRRLPSPMLANLGGTLGGALGAATRAAPPTLVDAAARPRRP